MMHRMIARALFFGLVLAAGCGDATEPTQVLIEVDTDLVPPTEVDSVVITVSDPTGQEMTSEASTMVGDRPFPRTLGVVNNSGRLGPFTAEIVARRGSTRVVSQTLRFSFVQDRVMQLSVFLSSTCENVRCERTETCRRGGVCGSQDVELEDWGGAGSSLSSPDAGVDTF